MIDISDVITRFPKRSPDAHKGDFGHVMVIAGSSGYTGAAYLTSQAAILSGCGLVTLAIGRSLYDIMASKLTEVMVRPFFETRDFSLSLLAEKELMISSEKCNSFAVGPGISTNKETQHLVRNIYCRVTRPLVLDADGVNSFVGHLDSLKGAKGPRCMTPHPGEMARLLSKDIKDIQGNRKDVALRFANEYNTVLVLKGSQTVVASPAGDVYINSTGNAGMATAGSGDVLTGMIASFTAQGMDLFSAAILGVYYHGMAGDMGRKEKGVLGLVASDLLNKLPEALMALA